MAILNQIKKEGIDNINLQFKAAILIGIKRAKLAGKSIFSANDIVKLISTDYENAWMARNPEGDYETRIKYIFKELRDQGVFMVGLNNGEYKINGNIFNRIIKEVAKQYCDIYNVIVYRGEEDDDTEIYYGEAENANNGTFLTLEDLEAVAEAAEI